MKKMALLLGLVLLMIPMPALADTIEFGSNGAGAGGTLSYLVVGGSLTGAAIPIAGVQGIFTPLNSGPTFGVSGTVNGSAKLNVGSLDFTSGAFASFSNGVYSWLAGSLTITGSVPGTSAGLLVSQPLLTSNSAAVKFDTTSGAFAVLIPSGGDTKSPALLAWFGEPSTKVWNFTGTVHANQLPCATGGLFGTNICSGSTTFTTTASGSTDVLNLAPEPSSAMLLGVGLLGLAFLGIRKRRTLGPR